MADLCLAADAANINELTPQEAISRLRELGVRILPMSGGLIFDVRSVRTQRARTALLTLMGEVNKVGDEALQAELKREVA